MKHKILYIIFLYLFVACSYFETKEVIPKEKIMLNQADQLFMDDKVSQALKIYLDVERQFPRSIYFLSARLGEADCYYRQNSFSLAEETYKDVYQRSLGKNSKLNTTAAFKLSFIYELLNDDVRAIAFALESNKNSRDLTENIQYAELPARLSMLYSKMGKSEEAKAYLYQAEKGVSRLKKGEMGGNKEWFAKMYLEMGKVSTYQLNANNFIYIVEGQKNNQKFLINVLDYNIPKYSKVAQDTLIQTYKDLWTLVMTLPEVKSKDAISIIERKNLQMKMANSFASLLDNAIKFEAVHGQSKNSFQEEYFNYVKTLKVTVGLFIHSEPFESQLTEESKLNSKSSRKKDLIEKNIPMQLPLKKGTPAQQNSTELKSQDPNI